MARGGQKNVGEAPPIESLVVDLRRALEESYLVHLQCYCWAQCAVRTVDIFCKDLDATLLEIVLVNQGFRCPVCGNRMKVHWLHSPKQHDDRERFYARMSVNTQMWERDHRGPETILVGIPATVLIDDRLPPTPDGWFGNAPPEDSPRRFLITRRHP